MNRRDGWEPEDDIILAQIVLEHIRNGSTQLSGFEAAANQLQRTSNACGFRWNSAVRKQYESQINEAKAARKALKETNSKLVAINQPLTISTEDDIDAPSKTPLDGIIESLQALREDYIQSQATISRLKQRVHELTEQLESKDELATPTEDLENLLHLIRKVESSGLLERIVKNQKPAG
ncbi:Prespore-specific transcriptional regulator RsfA [compost metagenome]